MLTPRQAISRNQVFLRPFGDFIPEEQGYMGFSDQYLRDKFLSRIETGALVLIWSRSKTSEKKWAGYFRGILQLEKLGGHANIFSTALGQKRLAESDANFDYAVRVCKAWEADPLNKVKMKNVIPTDWPARTQHIGKESAQIAASDISNIEHLRIRETTVFGHPPVSSAPYDSLRSLFK